MPCYAPLKGYRAKASSKTGKRPIVFSLSEAHVDQPVKVPCGQCIGCRIDKSRQWAVRCLHEASLHKENSFITLTYHEAALPPDKSVRLRDFQLFMKRLRKKYGPNIRYYHCGEYGEKNNRPHYHAILFNHGFNDKILHRVINKNNIYTSEQLETLWPHGYSSIGNVTFQSAAYVARYIIKKVTGSDAKEHYQYIDETTGEIHQRKPEYTTMSRRPGIGQGWLETWATDIYPVDTVIIDGKKNKVPKYYDKQFEQDNPQEYAEMRRKRKILARRQVGNNTPERLAVREEVQERKVERLPRNLE